MHGAQTDRETLLLLVLSRSSPERRRLLHTSLKDCYFFSSLCSPAHSPPTRPSNSSLISSSSSHGSLLPLSLPPYDLGGVSFSRLGFQDKRQNIASSSLLQLDPRGKYDPKLQFPFLFLEFPSKTLRSTYVRTFQHPSCDLPPSSGLSTIFLSLLPPPAAVASLPPSPLSSLSPPRRNLISQSVSPPSPFFSSLSLLRRQLFLLLLSSFLPPRQRGKGGPKRRR